MNPIQLPDVRFRAQMAAESPFAAGFASFFARRAVENGTA
jgi:hypothetical protein